MNLSLKKTVYYNKFIIYFILKAVNIYFSTNKLFTDSNQGKSIQKYKIALIH